MLQAWSLRLLFFLAHLCREDAFIGAWYSGCTQDFGSCKTGSTPVVPTIEINEKQQRNESK